MKKMKKIMQLCLAVLTVITVVSVAKIDSKAATQITGFKQVKGDLDSVELKWDWGTYNPSAAYALVYFRPWGSGEAWEEAFSTSNSVKILQLTPGTSYEMKVAVYGDDESIALAETPNSIEVVTAPGDEGTLTINQTKATTTSATFAWNKYPGANYFQIKYDRDGKNRRVHQVQYASGNQIKVSKLPKNKKTDISVIPCRRSSAGFNAVSSYRKKIGVLVVPTTPVITSGRTIPSSKMVDFDVPNDLSQYADGCDFDIYRVKGNKRVALLKSRKDSNGFWKGLNKKNKAFGSNELFKVKSRAYVKTKNGKKYYSPWSSMYYFWNGQVDSSFVSSGGIQLNWHKVKGARGYKVYAATQNNPEKQPKKFTMVANIKQASTTSITIKEINKKPLKYNQGYVLYVKPYYKKGKKIFEAVDCSKLYLYYQNNYL